jgi:lysyl-tRNA synthetase class II
VGGLERVYEVGRIFRNEGIDTRHNPEFTLVEVYQALADAADMMDLTERLVSAAAAAASLAVGALGADGPDGTLVEGGLTGAEGPSVDVDLRPPWPRRRLVDLIAEHCGVQVDVHSDPSVLRAVCERFGVDHEPHWGPGKLLYALFDKRVEEHLGHDRPVFAYEYPAEVSPLAKPKTDDPELVDRFELFVGGRERANGYSALNDPVRQRRMCEAEVAAAVAGDEEAQRSVDEDYLRALEYGLPPTGGLGVGVDRLVMLLAGQASIREVILFPTLRPES